MPEYLLDTDHLSYIQERHNRVLQQMAAHPPWEILTSVVNLGELLQGIYDLPLGRKKRELLVAFHEIVQNMESILPVTISAAQKFAEVASRLRRNGRPIPSNDIWIAAVALVHGAVLVTNDVHFQYIEGLKVENWTR